MGGSGDTLSMVQLNPPVICVHCPWWKSETTEYIHWSQEAEGPYQYIFTLVPHNRFIQPWMSHIQLRLLGSAVHVVTTRDTQCERGFAELVAVIRVKDVRVWTSVFLPVVCWGFWAWGRSRAPTFNPFFQISSLQRAILKCFLILVGNLTRHILNITKLLHLGISPSDRNMCVSVCFI